MYIFDTDIISNTSRKQPSARLLHKLSRVPRNLQFTTSINVAELYFGAYHAANSERYLGWIENMIMPNITVLGFDAPASKEYGRIKADLIRKGTPRSEPDLQIAAIVLSRGYKLITGNLKHFAGIARLRAENWL